MNILVIDAETTGLEQPIGLVECSWTLLGHNEEFNEYFIDEDSSRSFTTNPEMPISEGASAKHGIRDCDITPDLPTISEIPFPKEPCLFIAHNVPYDRPIFEPYLNIIAELCTLRLARRLIHGPINHRLGTLAAYLGLSRQISHRATGDVIHCAELLMYMLGKHKLTVEAALKYLDTPFVYKFMPWGKHKGLLLTDVPKGYLAWLIKQDLDKDMRTTINYVLTGRV